MNKHFFGCILAAVCLVASCKPKEQNNFAEVIKIVDETEVIVNTYDSTVSIALINKKIDFINVLSKGATDSTNLKLNDLKNLKIYPPNEELRSSSINYIKSLQKFISAESQYALITDTTDIAAAKQMDANVLKEINAIEQMRYKYRLAIKESSK